MLMVSEDIMERCCARKPTTIPMFNKARAEYRGGGTADGHEADIFLVRCKRCHTEAGRWQKFQMKLLDITFSLNVPPQNNFHIVILTVSESILERCYAKTDFNVPVFIPVCVK